MVNIPFVSEDFQRQFRNQFPSQTQTGRDLHVSDIVIPIVDFTNTAEGTTLPTYLQRAIGNGSTFSNIFASGTTTLISTPGFWEVKFSLTNVSGDANAVWQLDDGTSATDVIQYGNNPANGPGNLNDFIIFIPAGQSLQVIFSEGSGASASLRQTITQRADVNGNLVYPPSFSPQ
jgi:hypothetical protein